MKLWYKEENFINYMDNNKEFLKAIHYLYYIKFKKQLEGYTLKDYMVIAYINFNRINNFNNYISFKNKYLLQLDPNIKEAYKLTNDFAKEKWGVWFGKSYKFRRKNKTSWRNLQ